MGDSNRVARRAEMMADDLRISAGRLPRAVALPFGSPFRQAEMAIFADLSSEVTALMTAYYLVQDSPSPAGLFIFGKGRDTSRILECLARGFGRGWGFRLREARNKHSGYAPSRISVSATSISCGADAGRAHYAAPFHQRLHFT